MDCTSVSPDETLNIYQDQCAQTSAFAVMALLVWRGYVARSGLDITGLKRSSIRASELQQIFAVGTAIKARLFTVGIAIGANLSTVGTSTRALFDCCVLIWSCLELWVANRKWESWRCAGVQSDNYSNHGHTAYSGHVTETDNWHWHNWVKDTVTHTRS